MPVIGDLSVHSVDGKFMSDRVSNSDERLPDVDLVAGTHPEKVLHQSRRSSGAPATTMGASSGVGAKYAEITAVVALYWVISIAMVMANKSLLGGRGNEGSGVDAPIFITWFQAICSIITIRLFGRQPWAGGSASLDLSMKPNDLKAVLPLSLVFVGMVTFNNLCIKYVGVAFYYVNRSLTTIFNVIFSYAFLGQSHSKQSLAWCGVILAGFFIGVDQEAASGLSVAGVIPGVLASAFVAMNAILTKKYLAVVDGSILRLGLLNNVNAALIFIPLILLGGEIPVLISYNDIASSWFWTAMTITGVLGFAVGAASALQIKVTSPLTHNVSGTAKASAQTVLAVLYYHEIKTAIWWTSNAVVLLGSMGYTKAKQVEMGEAFVKQQKQDCEQGRALLEKEKN